MTRNLDVPDEYAALYRVYDSAIEQASEGKGKERHAEDGEPYERQIICEVARRVGLGYPLGQAVKKIYESQRLGGDAGVQELLGALNYVAAAVIVMKEKAGERSVPKDGDELVVLWKHKPKAEGGCCQNGNDQPEKPEFKFRDKVQARLGDGVWRDAVVSDKEITCGKLCYTVKIADFSGYYILQADDVRPAPKVEGCEALVEKDAPQTKEELYQYIVDCNPATFHTPSYAEEQLEHCSRLQTHKPTGEELAEMAEEVPHG